MGAGFERLAHARLRVLLRCDKERHHAVLQELVVARAEERRLANGLRRAPKGVLHPLSRREIVGEVLLAVAEVDQPLGEVGVLRPVLGREGLGKPRRDIAQGELAVVVVGEVDPVLLDMELIGVEGVELDPSIGVLIDQCRQIRQGLGREVVHLWGFVVLDNQHPITGYRRVAVAEDTHLRVVAAHQNLHADLLFELDNVVGADGAVVRAGHLALLEGKDPDTRVFEGHNPLIVLPLGLATQANGERAGLRVSQPLAVVHPDPRLPGRAGVGGADLQRREERELQPEAIVVGKGTDLGDLRDVLVFVGREGAWGELAGAVLVEEVVVGDNQSAMPRRIRLLTDRAQAAHGLLKGQAQVQLLLGMVRDNAQLGITHQDHAGAPQQKRPRAGKTHQLPRNLNTHGSNLQLGSFSRACAAART